MGLFLLYFVLAEMLSGEFFSLPDYGFYGVSGKALRYVATQSCLLQRVLARLGF